MSQMHALGTSGVIWGHFGVILESQCVIKRIRQIRKRLNASVVSNRLQIVLSPDRFSFCISLIHIAHTCEYCSHLGEANWPR